MDIPDPIRGARALARQPIGTFDLPMTSPSQENSREWAVQLAAVALALGIFVVDMETPLGYAEWALYLPPIGLTLFQRRPWVPFAMTLATSLLNAAGYVLSPAGMDGHVALVNRLMGTASTWMMAAVIWQVLRSRAQVDALLWLQRSEGGVAQRLLGEQLPHEVANQATSALCAVLDAQTAVLYRREGKVLLREGGYALDLASASPRIELSEGLAGQVAKDGVAQCLRHVPEGHLPMVSGLGRSSPRHLLVAPLTADGMVNGIVELGFLRESPDFRRELALLQQVAEPIGVALQSAVYRQRLESLLEETQRQGESLQAQQEELRVSNEELSEQSRSLQESQARLETQQVELEQTNVQLEEQAQVLERQKLDLLAAQQELHANADRLEAASRCKSEFLANMSHELRTPLNSSLILSRLLADNKPRTLNDEQVKYAEAINASNNDLLLLINDILDLSKIEAGHVDLVLEPASLAAVLDRLRATFEPLARQKRLAFEIERAPGLPDDMVTDPRRLEQILKNLLANAVKFTERGEVRLVLRALPGDRVQFEVRDSGMGIPRHQQQIIFEAFRQADGSTSRRFGGTGLGLSISRELAHRLGGDITVDSEPGRGSSFVMALPRVLDAEAAATLARKIDPPRGSEAAAVAPPPPAVPEKALATPAAAPQAAPATAGIPDDRHQFNHPGRLILAVEDDARFARVLYDLAHELGFDCVIAPTGTEAIALARELKPSGILLDVGLPDQSGLTVLERLKRDATTRHLPVHMMSAHEREQTALELGAIGYVHKPADRDELAAAIRGLQDRLQRELRRVLIVEDDDTLRHNLVLLLSAEHVEIQAVGSVAGALEHLAGSTFDCMVMDLQLSDGSGHDLLDRMAAGEQYGFPPVIVYTGRVLSRDEELRLRRHSRSIIVKGARSPERLLDEVTLFLHSVESSLPPEQQRLLSQARERDSVLDGRRILLAEDDARNIFALSSVFEPLGARLEIARNGREALERLQQASAPQIDLVLMDIMMPEMDGITAMKLIRERPEWANLPMIALTAKAMSDDRDRCLEAGANDYVAKPIDVDKLISLCRVWMPK
jgi:CheY-like chemotaxis protein/signal transduction histidine kinase